MFRTQIYLTENEREQLTLLAQELGQHQSALIREAIDLFIENKRKAKRNKKEALRAAAGLWVDRNDLPDAKTLRKEFDRQAEYDT